MDYFESNFNEDRTDQHAELPEGYGWEDMKEGVYDKMPASKGTTKNRLWSLLLLLLIGGCGTGAWFVSNYMGSSKQHTSQNIKEDRLRQDADTEKNRITTEHEKSNQDSNNQTLSQTPLAKTEPKKNNSIIENYNDNKINTTYSNPLKNQKPEIVGFKEPRWSSSLVKNFLTSVVTEDKPSSTIKMPKVEWKVSEPISTLPVQLLNIESNFEDPILELHVSENSKEQDTQHSQKEIVFGLSSGIVNWAAFDGNNINHDYNSGYPGFTISPSLSLNFNEKHAIQLDYEYSQFEELFDYQGSHAIEVVEEDVTLIEVRSSLTGNILEEHQGDTLVQGTRYYNEVKYNDYNTHTFNIGYRNDQIKWSKSSISFYAGASYLFSINQKGKRLNEQMQLVKFDNANPVFQSNQLGLKLALQYSYKLNDNIDLFSRLMSTKYLTNWEVSSSNASSRPLIYGLNIGFNYRFLR